MSGSTLRGRVMNLLPDEVTSAFTQRTIPPQARDGRIRCKFVLMRAEAVNIMVVGLVDTYPYHANLVEKYCDVEGIASHWLRKPDQVEILDRCHCVAGGGWLELNFTDGQMKAYGYSTAYGPFDRVVFRQLPTSAGFFDRASVVIEGE